MSFRTFPGGLPRRFRVVQQSFLHRDDLPFAEVLSEQDIQTAFDTEGVSFAQEDGDVYTPSVTLWAFLSQAVFKAEHRSCVAAVARVAVLMAALNRRVSDDTGAYCRARAKLPEVVLERLALQLADGCEETAPSDWLWHRRHIHLVDGTTLSSPDTPANQAAWPQPNTQKKGLGFPLIRMVVLMSLATAMMTGMALGPCEGKETGETALFRSLLKHLPRGDIFVADRYLCSYFMIALARERGVDAVVRQHQLRITDFRRGQSLGKEDHLARWRRPARPAWMDVETYEQMPEFLDVRELRVHVHQPGFRTEAFVVVTTLTDHQTYSSQDIAALYHKRWLVELDIRALKVSLGIDVLRCRSPHMVRKEIWTCLLAYNLIRKTIVEAAYAANVSPRELSFTAAMQAIAAGWTAVLLLDEAGQVRLIDLYLDNLAGYQVGHRPNRIEPRAIKRRPKPHRLLTKPRAAARRDKSLVAGRRPH
ncbi:MAG: IS4 family transposase [Pirellulaceae bacterium]